MLKCTSKIILNKQITKMLNILVEKNQQKTNIQLIQRA